MRAPVLGGQCFHGSVSVYTGIGYMWGGSWGLRFPIGTLPHPPGRPSQGLSLGDTGPRIYKPMLLVARPVLAQWLNSGFFGAIGMENSAWDSRPKQSFPLPPESAFSDKYSVPVKRE